MDDSRKHWEQLLAKEGMPSELRLLTESHSGSGHNDGLVCVSMTLSICKTRLDHNGAEDSNRHGTGQQAKEWFMKANVRHWGRETGINETDVANYWREFSARIWESGVAGERLEFLLDYAEHGFLSRSCLRFGWDRYFGGKLIDFVLNIPRKVEPNNGK